MPSPTRPTRIRLIAVVATVGLLAGCTGNTGGHGIQQNQSTSSTTSAVGGTPTQSPPSTIAFSDCAGLFNLSAAGIPADRREKLQFSCGQLPVPVDYAHPSAAQLNIQVIRIHYNAQPQRVGSLLVNPGGPGGSGVFLAISLAASLSEDVLQHFDLVGFDPRGVGLSAPIKCQTDAEETKALAFDADVRTAAGQKAAKGQAATFARSCTKKYGSALAHYNTVETARDMDRIRAAVGDQKLNYLGFSYGTELGAVYAHLFPTRIRVAVLDGAVDPVTTGNAITSNEQQLGGFEDAFDQFAADCRKRTACKALGDPRKAVAALQKKANATPIPSSKHSDKRRATGGNVLYAVVSALYSQELWPSLGTALIDAQHGDAEGLLELNDRYSERGDDGHYSNLLDVFQVVTCNDQKSDPSDATIKATAAKWAKKYPLFGLWSAPTLFQCQAWQKSRSPVPTESAAGSAPILVVGNLHDPATPYSGAVHLASTLRTGVLLTWDGQGHTSYGQSSCIDAKVNAYLIQAAIPAAHTTCPR
ncbi:MAG TPA: alpha/beta hydrolase [Jatrophihabitantaceae bacterium]|nr:alpha/beta hydrolase [Jatrophihabitantaceae bacterium]